MAEKVKNPLAQALGLVLQGMRDKMGGVSSSEIAVSLGLAASHYRMIEAGSALLQPSRAIKVVQAFETIEFVPLCQILVAVRIVDAAKQSVTDMRTTTALLMEANPALAKVLEKFDGLWEIVETAEPIDVAREIASRGIEKELASFLTTEPMALAAGDISSFMTPTYEHPMAGQLYDKIGNILQGVAPFYLDTIFQLIDNLRNITPRVTAEELARWETSHRTRISHIIGIVRKPEIVLDVDTFDYSFLWEENFQKMLVIHRDEPKDQSKPIQQRITDLVRTKYESEHIRYERELQSFDQTVNEKLKVAFGKNHAADIDKILLHDEVSMNNLWVYIMANGYVVPFIDNATVGGATAGLYGTSLAYDETCEKLVNIRKICSDVGFAF